MEATEEMIRRSEEAAKVEEITEQTWRETAQVQIEEFNASRKKQLENLSDLISENAEKAPAPITKEDQFSNIIELIDLQRDSNDGVDRSRMRQVLLQMKH